eukprot:gnl/TRDRNA2_/TRDRNA2_187163_c0_seq1.p1 gnl/TRDRNA2_/TRDRNA2_187163_c0~~gnl/TRDRNA2_/TRDRNA2_187163_c0_seq1.p1  ORF type:complete len:456 (+),score=80.00 gnl/TRDRNA2_/TRDRNA2_187163_c0_seq1:96-1463(+)
MWWMVGPHLERRCATERGEETGVKSVHQQHSYFNCTRNTDEFCEVLKAKYGSVARAWRVALDADSSGLLDFREFVAAMKDVGYQGNLRSLWYNLDIDQSGYVSLYELDKDAAKAYDKFRVRCTRKYKTIANCWDKLLDDDHSGTVALGEFVSAAVAELEYSEAEARQLFDLLRVRPGSRFITLSDISFLQEWEDRKKDMLVSRQLGSSWVNKDPHFNEGARVGAAPTALRKSTMMFLQDDDGLKRLSQLEAVQQDIEDYSTQIGPDQVSEWEDFKTFLTERYGSLCDAFDALDMDGSGKLDIDEFQMVVCGTLRYCRPADARRLFNYFTNEGHWLTWQDLGIKSAEWIRHVTERKMARIERANAVAAMKASGPGHSPRAREAEKKHMTKMTVSPRNVFAFTRPLPPGWGFPPTYDPYCEEPPPPTTREMRAKKPISKRVSLLGPTVSVYESGKGG